MKGPSIMHRYILTLLIIISCSKIFAEPNPFGLEINKSTYKDVKKKYSGRFVGINKFSGGKMYDIYCNQINIDGLKEISTIFSKEGKLLAILTTFNKNKYDSLMSSLSQKYKLISKKDAFVGNKHATFKSDNTLIELNAPHMSFNLYLRYIHEDFNKQFLNTSEKEREASQEHQTSSL